MSIYHMRVENHDSCVSNALQACDYIVPQCAAKTETCEEFHGWDGLVDEDGYVAGCSGDDCPSEEVDLSALLRTSGGRLAV